MAKLYETRTASCVGDKITIETTGLITPQTAIITILIYLKV